jgi:MSHA pilin protein MshD
MPRRTPHPAHRPALPRRRGFTLPEALIAIVVLGVGLTGVMLAFSTTMRRSADPMLRLQLLSIAEGLMEEIQLKPFAPVANTAPGGCSRSTYNDIGDYDGYTTTGICTVDGVAIAALSAYNVSVTVRTGTLGALGTARRITVTATGGSETLQLVGWRTDYAGP